MIMIIYIGYDNFRDYEYLRWVKFGTHLSYEYDHEWVPIARTQTVDLSQTAPAEVMYVPVLTRLSRHSHQLHLQLDKKKSQTNWEQRSNAFHRGQ